jgi:hypothetical protein
MLQPLWLENPSFTDAPGGQEGTASLHSSPSDPMVHPGDDRVERHDAPMKLPLLASYVHS